jgi:hypothetical protein
MASGIAPSRHDVAEPASGPNVPASETFIVERLEQTRRQVKTVDITTGIAILLVGILAYLLAAMLFDQWFVAGGLGRTGRFVAWMGLVCGMGVFAAIYLLPSFLYRINPIFAAHTLEQTRPTFKNSLINFLLISRHRDELLRDDLSKRVFEGLKYRAAAELTHVPPEIAVDRARLVRFGYILAGLVAFCAVYFIFSPKNPFVSFGRVVIPWAQIQPPSRVTIGAIEPGHVEAYQGETVPVTAEIRGLRSGEPVMLYYDSDDGQIMNQAIPMAVPEGDYRWRCEFPPGSLGLQQNMKYRLVAGDCTTASFRIGMLIPLTISVDEVEYRYPEYTGLPPQKHERQGDLRALEGSQVVLRASTNQAIAQAQIEFDGDARTAVRMDIDGRKAVGRFTLQMSAGSPILPEHTSYLLRFTDPDRRENRRPVRYQIEVVPDLKPDVQFVERPDDGAQMPVNGSLTLKVQARDPDFGLRRVGLRMEQRGRAIAIPPLLNASKPEKAYAGAFAATYVLEPKKLGLRPGDQIVYWAEAADNREDAKGPAPNLTETEKRTITVAVEEAASSAASRGANSSSGRKDRGDDKKAERGQESLRNDPAADDGAKSPDGEKAAARPKFDRGNDSDAAAGRDRKDREEKNNRNGKDPAKDDASKNDRANDDRASNAADRNKQQDQGDSTSERKGQGSQNEGSQGDKSNSPNKKSKTQDKQDAQENKSDSSKSDRQDAGATNDAAKNGAAGKDQADKNQADKNQADKNQADKNQADKNQADKNQADKNQADKNQADKNQADKGASTGESSSKSDQAGKSSPSAQGNSKDGQSGAEPPQSSKPGGEQGKGQEPVDGATNPGDAIQKIMEYRQEKEQKAGGQSSSKDKQEGQTKEQQGQSKDNANPQNNGQPQQQDAAGPSKEEGQGGAGDKNQNGNGAGDKNKKGGDSGDQGQKGQGASDKGQKGGDGQKSESGQKNPADKQGQADAKEPADGQKGDNADKGSGSEKGGGSSKGRDGEKAGSESASGNQDSKGAGSEKGGSKGGASKNDASKGDAGDASKEAPKANPSQSQGSEGVKSSDAAKPATDPAKSSVPQAKPEGNAAAKDKPQGQPEGVQTAYQNGEGTEGERQKPNDGLSADNDKTDASRSMSGKPRDPQSSPFSGKSSERKAGGSDGQRAASAAKDADQKARPSDQGTPGGQPSSAADKGKSQKQDAAGQTGGKGDPSASSGRAADDAKSQGAQGNEKSGKNASGQPDANQGKNSDGASGAEGKNAGKSGDKSSQSSGSQNGDAKRSDRDKNSSDAQRSPNASNGASPSNDKSSKASDSSQNPQQQPGASGREPGRGGAPGTGAGTGPDGAATEEQADPVNLEHAKQQTTLALQTLEEELAKEKPELLERLGWNKADAQKFLKQWQQMRQAAKEPGPRGEAAKRELDRALKSLGLTPHGVRIRADRTANDRQQSQDVGRLAPPPEWADRYRDYTQGVGRGTP